MKRTLEFFRRFEARLIYLRTFLTTLFGLSALGKMIMSGFEGSQASTYTLISLLMLAFCYLCLSEAIVQVQSRIREKEQDKPGKYECQQKMYRRKWCKHRRSGGGGPSP